MFRSGRTAAETRWRGLLRPRASVASGPARYGRQIARTQAQAIAGANVAESASFATAGIRTEASEDFSVAATNQTHEVKGAFRQVALPSFRSESWSPALDREIRDQHQERFAAHAGTASALHDEDEDEDEDDELEISTMERLLREGSLRDLEDMQFEIERERYIKGAAATKAAMISSASAEDLAPTSLAEDEPLSTPVKLPSRFVDPMTKLLAIEKATLEGVHSSMVSTAEKQLKPLKNHYLAWFTTMSRAITREQERVKGSRSFRKEEGAAFLTLLPPDLLAMLAIQEMMHMVYLHPQGVTVTSLAMRMGRSVRDEINLLKASVEVDAWSELRRRAHRDGAPADSRERFLDWALHSSTWDNATTAKMGATLIHMLCRCAFLQTLGDDYAPKTERVPAFFQSLMLQSERKVGVVVAHHALLASLLQNGKVDEFMQMNMPLTRPMVCPPRPWTSPFDGGFVSQRFGLLRTVTGARNQLHLLRKQDPDNTRELYEGVNALNNVAWTLNKELYEVALETLERDITFTGRPSLEDDEFRDLQAQITIDEKMLLHIKKYKTESSPDQNELTAAVQKSRRTRQEYVSKNLDFMSKMSLAEFVSAYEQFWFPYSLDFRGRAYPIPPVSHMGDDLARSLLVFKDKRPLGEKGLYWLKVHLANQMGQDKASFDERVAWVNEHLEELLDCAREPFDKTDPKHKPKLWATGEKCWQALATCMELRAALECDDPTKFMSCLPVHQDGSCNGLQHYAALGRDRHGGSEVNLVARERPGDVYTAVAVRVRELIREIAEGSNPPGTEDDDYDKLRKFAKRKELARKLDGQISRKVVKQSVMTSVYGVTLIGARDQILRQLETVNAHNKELRAKGQAHGAIFERDDDLNAAAGLLADVVLNAIGDTFRSAKEIKEWFKAIGRIATEAGDPISWITPLGVPVVQPYRKKGKVEVSTVMQRMVLTEVTEDAAIDKSKQQSAFPPNFIHSMDSTHMLMTARSCSRAGLCFTAVHDSFWTHAGDVEVMNDQLRREFIKLHSQNILEDLYEQFVARYPQRAHRIPRPPERGDLDLNEVMESKYFFN